MTASTIRRSTVTTRLTAVGAIAVAGALLLTGCGDQTEKKSTSTSSKAPLAGKLPASIKSAGVIKVGSEIAYPPVEYKENSKIVGIDPDIAAALGKQLGVTFQFNNGSFDSLLTSLQSKRYDVVMSALSDTKDRQTGVNSDTGKKVGEGVDFVDYLTAGVQIYVAKGNPQSISGWDDLCGKKIAVQRNTVSHDAAKEQSTACTKDGKKAISIEAFSADTEAQTRLRAGGVVAGVSDFPVAVYAAKTSGGGKDFELVGDQAKADPYGIALTKDNTKLRDALQAAMNAIIENGEYAKILKKWGAQNGAVTESKINGGS